MPDLAIGWPDVMKCAGYEVSNLKRWRESNNVESYSGVVEQGKAKARIWIGPGPVGSQSAYPDNACYVMMTFKCPLLIDEPGPHYQLAVNVERLLLQAGAKLPS